MKKQNSFHYVWQRLVSVLLVFSLFIAIFPARIIHAEEPEEDLFVSETAEEMAEDYAAWPNDTLPEDRMNESRSQNCVIPALSR